MSFTIVTQMYRNTNEDKKNGTDSKNKAKCKRKKRVFFFLDRFGFKGKHDTNLLINVFTGFNKH